MPVPVTVVAQYRVTPLGVDAVREALRLMTEPTRGEPGCLAYDVYVDPADDTLVLLVERYIDQDAFAAHLASEHFERLLRRVVLPLLAERVRFDLVPLDRIDEVR